MHRTFCPPPAELVRSQIQLNGAQGIRQLSQLPLSNHLFQTGVDRFLDRRSPKRPLRGFQCFLVNINGRLHAVHHSRISPYNSSYARHNTRDISAYLSTREQGHSGMPGKDSVGMAEQCHAGAALSATTPTPFETPDGPVHPHLVEPESAVLSVRSCASPARSMAPTAAQTWR
jgi:hypothetical protein